DQCQIVAAAGGRNQNHRALAVLNGIGTAQDDVAGIRASSISAVVHQHQRALRDDVGKVTTVPAVDEVIHQNVQHIQVMVSAWIGETERHSGTGSASPG